MSRRIIATLVVILVIFYSMPIVLADFDDSDGATFSDPGNYVSPDPAPAPAPAPGGGFWGTGVGRAISGFLGLFGITVGSTTTTTSSSSSSSSGGTPKTTTDPTLEAFKDQGGCDRAGTCASASYATAACGGNCESYQTDKGFGASVSGEGSRTDITTTGGSGGTGTFTCTIVTGGGSSSTTNSEPDRSLDAGGGH